MKTVWWNVYFAIKLWLIDFPKSILLTLLFILLNHSQCLGIDSFVVCRVDAHPDKLHTYETGISRVDHGMNEPQLIWF